METTIRINTDNLTSEILEGIKKLFPHKTVEITIQSADETEFILGNPTYAEDLLQRIKEYDSNKQTITLKAEQLI